MQRHAARARGPFLTGPSRLVGGMLFLAVAGLAGSVRSEEPAITSFQDAACRAEAKARVFSVPDPLNIGLREIGKQLYFGCMKRSTRGHHHKKRRHRRR